MDDLQALLHAMQRVERKLDLLIAALGEEVNPEPVGLDGEPLPRERDQSRPL